MRWRTQGRRPSRIAPIHPHPVTILETPCREWWGHHNARGYGRISVNGKATLVHRHIWALANGAIPEGVNILHRCDNPPCFRLDHLRLGSQGDNMRDRAERRRHPGALTESQIDLAHDLQAQGVTQQSIADEIGCHQATISRLFRKDRSA